MKKPELNNSLEDFWCEYATSYDKILPLTPFYQVAVGRHIKAILDGKSKRVLDIGCGTGNVSIPLAYMGLNILAVDNSYHMLNKMKTKANALDLNSSIQFIEEDAGHLNIESKFDAVNCLLALFCMDKGALILNKMINSLRTGGIICLTEPLWSFQEEPLLEYAHEIIFSKLDRKDLQTDWEVVSNAGKRLGNLIRTHSSDRNTDQKKIRADEIPAHLEEMGCQIIHNSESHLGECRFISACKIA